MTHRDRDRRLVTLWNQHCPTRDIAHKLGFRQHSSVSHAAKRLGLTPRIGNRNTNAATAANAARRAKQARDEAQMLKNLAKATLTDHGPTPKWFRCQVCGGKSATPVHAAHIEQMWIVGAPVRDIARKLGAAS